MDSHTHTHTHRNDTAPRRVKPDRGLFFYKSPVSFLSIAQDVLPQDKLTETHKLGHSATHFSAGRTLSFLTQPAGLSSLQHGFLEELSFDFCLSRDPKMIK